MSEHNESHGGHRLAARRLMRSCGKAAMATTASETAAPYVSLVTIAFDLDGSPILLLSRLADHTRNIIADPRVALLFDATDGYANAQEGPRLSVLGTAAPANAAHLRRRFLARHPGAALYAGFADFAIHRVSIERAHLVEGFARSVWLRDGMLADPVPAALLVAAEEDILRHMNEEHGAAIDLYAHHLLSLSGNGWRMTGIDLDGCDLQLGSSYARLAFDSPLTNISSARETLAELARRGRDMGG